MSYRCGYCNVIVPRGVSKSKYSRVTETRPRTYHNEKLVTIYQGEKTYTAKQMVASNGTEIVKVVALCPMEAGFFDETHLSGRGHASGKN